MNRHSALLIDEPPLQVLPGLAVRLGDRRAMFLQQVHYWLTIARKKGTFGREIDGEMWIFNSLEAWQKDNFPFWSLRTIRRIVSDLIQAGVLKTASLFNDQKIKCNYYTINYDKLNLLMNTPVGQFDPTEDDNLSGNDPETGDSDDDGKDNLSPIREDSKIQESLTETTRAPKNKKEKELQEFIPEGIPDDVPEDIAEGDEEEEKTPVPPENLYGDPNTVEGKYRERLAKSMANAKAYQDGPDVIDVSYFPDDVREVIGTFCVLWHFRPSRARKADWIAGAREVLAACAEYEPENVLTEYRKSFVRYMQANNGRPPYTVNGIRSIVKSIDGFLARDRERAARLANQAPQDPRDRSQSYYFGK